MSRPIVIDAAALGLEYSGGRRREVEWWRACDAEELREELARLPLGDVESLLSEVNAAMKSAGTTANDTSADPAWRARARRALAGISQRRGIIAATARARQTAIYEDQGRQRARIVTEARALAERGDVQAALLLVLEWVDSFGRQKSVGAERHPERAP